jgi:hypothetical protein
MRQPGSDGVDALFHPIADGASGVDGVLGVMDYPQTSAVLALAAHDGVTVTGAGGHPAFVDRAFAFVVPLRSGSGTRLRSCMARDAR